MEGLVDPFRFQYGTMLQASHRDTVAWGDTVVMTSEGAKMKSPVCYEPRWPRYTARTAEGLQFSVYVLSAGDTADQRSQQLSEARLLELSRGGLRFAVDSPLPEGTPLRVTLAMEGLPACQQLAFVRWCDPAGTIFHCGAGFSELLPWEVLGELILRGHVATD